MIGDNGSVSTDTQSLANQVGQPESARRATIIHEKISGTHVARSHFKKLTAKLAVGDVVVIPAVYRLSCGTTDFQLIAHGMQCAGAGRRSRTEPVTDNTSNIAERVLAKLGPSARLARRRTMESTARGRPDGKAKGVKFGRKTKLTRHQQKESRKRTDDEPQRSIARSYNLSQAAISRLTI